MNITVTSFHYLLNKHIFIFSIILFLPKEPIYMVQYKLKENNPVVEK